MRPILNMRKSHICMNIYRLITAFFTHNIELNERRSNQAEDAMNHMVTTKKQKFNFNWQDPFLIEQQLSSR